MKNLSNISYFFSWALLAVTVYAFLRLFNDSMDLDIMNFQRSHFFNKVIPTYLLPVTIILFATWIDRVIIHFKTFESTSKYSQKSFNLPTLFWWVPILNFVGPVISLNELMDNVMTADMEETEVKKLKSGSRWIKISFLLFYSLAILGFLFFYFYETNRDGHDFFLNLLFIFLITLSISTLKMTSVLRK